MAAPRSPAPTLVMVHGLAVSHRYLMPLAAKLAGHHPVHRVVETLAHAPNDPIEDKLPLISVPVLVTRGSREPIVPMA